MKTRLFIHVSFGLAIGFVLYIIYTFSHTSLDWMKGYPYNGVNRALVAVGCSLIGITFSAILGFIKYRKK